MDIACPDVAGFKPTQDVLEHVSSIASTTGSNIRVVTNVIDAAKNSDIVSYVFFLGNIMPRLS